MTAYSRDLDKLRYLNFAELAAYCATRAAGVVGEVSARIFGIAQTDNPATLNYARTLGGRYSSPTSCATLVRTRDAIASISPQEDLDRFGVSSSSPLRGQPTGDFTGLMQFQFERAALTYERAYALLSRRGPAGATTWLPSGDGRNLSCVARRDSSDGFRVLDHRVALTPLRKLWIAWKTYQFA